MKFNSKNIQLGMNVRLGKNVKIGDNTVIYDNVIIGDNSIIANNCIIGEPITGYYYNSNTYSNPETIIGKNCLVRSHTIIYCNNNIGDGLSTGHGLRKKCQGCDKTRMAVRNLLASHKEIGDRGEPLLAGAPGGRGVGSGVEPRISGQPGRSGGYGHRGCRSFATGPARKTCRPFLTETLIIY